MKTKTAIIVSAAALCLAMMILCGWIAIRIEDIREVVIMSVAVALVGVLGFKLGSYMYKP